MAVGVVVVVFVLFVFTVVSLENCQYRLPVPIYYIKKIRRSHFIIYGLPWLIRDVVLLSRCKLIEDDIMVKTAHTVKDVGIVISAR